MRSAVLGLLAQTLGVLAQPPQLLVYGEAACPDTRAFFLGPLTNAVEAFGPVNSTSWPLALFYLPWGNAYYLTSECPGGVPSPPHCHDSASCLYNSSVRTCFDASCGKGAHAPPSDCFNGRRCHHLQELTRMFSVGLPSHRHAVLQLLQKLPKMSMRIDWERKNIKLATNNTAIEIGCIAQHSGSGLAHRFIVIF